LSSSCRDATNGDRLDKPNEHIDPRWYIAPSVSTNARAKLEWARGVLAALPATASPQTLAEFDAAAARGAALAEQLTRAALDHLAPTVTAQTYGGVGVLKVQPQHYRDDNTAILYIHGGGFVQGSARGNLLTAALAAATANRRVISIDYTLAPRGTFTTILEEVAAVWVALLRERPARSIGLLGDSAGGCIAAAAALMLRERGLPLPASLILLSPVTDLSGEGDTNVTLAPVDYLDAGLFEVARRAYAPQADARDALVSPVHGDFTLGFPPVLLQVGTRELLLSDSVRLHRALRAAGQRSRLELYEGMPHVFQPFLADAPEGQAAWAEMAAFWAEHLSS
jgi:monoterpene epsilon-lactone hydrolase